MLKGSMGSTSADTSGTACLLVALNKLEQMCIQRLGLSSPQQGIDEHITVTSGIDCQQGIDDDIAAPSRTDCQHGIDDDTTVPSRIGCILCYDASLAAKSSALHPLPCVLKHQ